MFVQIHYHYDFYDWTKVPALHYQTRVAGTAEQQESILARHIVASLSTSFGKTSLTHSHHSTSNQDQSFELIRTSFGRHTDH